MKNMVDELVAKCEHCEYKHRCPGYEHGKKLKSDGLMVTEKQFKQSEAQRAILKWL